MDHRDSSRVEVSGQRFDATHVNGTFKRAACGFRDRENGTAPGFSDFMLIARTKLKSR